MSQEADPSCEPIPPFDPMARLKERRHQMILEALKEIDEGQLISHEAIEKWAASLE